MLISLNAFLLVSGLLFAIGFFGLLWHRNALILLMCLELMLNAVNLALVSISRYHSTFDLSTGEGHLLMGGNLFVFFIITVAALEVAVGLALIVALYRRRGTVMIDEFKELRH